MSLFRLFFPRLIPLPDTDYNQRLFLNDCGLGEPTLVANGLIQSGTIMRHIWHTGLTQLLPPRFQPKTILLLGLGSGSNARLVSQRFPKAKITAVEIDPGMVDIARKHCHLDSIPNLKVVVDDAYHFARSNRQDYDLILVDCFDGKYIPTHLEKISFYTSLRQHGRYLLTNRLWYGEHIPATRRFMSRLAKHFFYIEAHTSTNVIISLV